MQRLKGVAPATALTVMILMIALAILAIPVTALETDVPVTSARTHHEVRMGTINPANEYCIRAIGQQTREDGIQYRLSRFVVTEGDAMYNSLTGEALRGADEATQIARWFRVPEGMDEAALAYSIRQRWLQSAGGPGATIKNRFVLFLTTACNAHCEYCYEAGTRLMKMTEKTAEDVAEYILTHSGHDAPIKIRWFGGEPLCNSNAIDIISGRLNAAGLNYSSEAFTNGDLLPCITDEQLWAWHLSKIQFTVDDTGREYDRIKGLPDGAYDRICDSIDRVTALNIKVNLRIHYHPGKGPDAPMRVAEAFCGRKGVNPYCTMLYSGGDAEDYDGLFTVQRYIHEHGGSRISFPAVRIGYSCMAENRKTACITTNGHLSPCEHHPYGENYGSIYSNAVDRAVTARWAAKSRNYCKGCVLYPSCGKMALCPAEGTCSPAEIQHQVNRVKYLLRGTK